MNMANHFSEVLKNKKMGAIMFNNRKVAITIKMLFILLKILKVLIPALSKLDGSYIDCNI